MAAISARRLAKELQGLKSGTAAGITLVQADDLETWIMTIEVLGESIYKVYRHHCFRGLSLIRRTIPGRSVCSEVQVWSSVSYVENVVCLRHRPPDWAPTAIESPEVVFVVSDKYKPPMHPHVYTNGHICASILGNEWSPVLNVESVCMTLQSMLASCKVRAWSPQDPPATS